YGAAPCIGRTTRQTDHFLRWSGRVQSGRRLNGEEARHESSIEGYRHGMSELIVKNLHVKVADKEILKGIDLTVRQGETHALMGKNGSGKSTLASTMMGHP